MSYEQDNGPDYPDGEAPPVRWDVASMTRELIDEQWRPEKVAKPDNIELYTEDEDGNSRKRVRRTNEYVHIAEEQSRETEFTDVFKNTQNLSAACFIEFSTPKSRNRRELIYFEIKRIATEARKRPETPGGWDTLVFNADIVDDENFGWWMGRFTFSFEKKKDVL